MTRWSAITRTRGRRSALAYGSRSATAAEDNLNRLVRMKVKFRWTIGASLGRLRIGAGDDELKRRRWGCLLPRCLPLRRPRRCAPRCRTRTVFRPCPFPVGDESAVGELGLPGEFALEVVLGAAAPERGCPGLALRARRARLQFEPTELAPNDGGALVGVVLAAAQEVPGEHGQLARDGDRGDVAAAAGGGALGEGSQRSRRFRARPGRLDERVPGRRRPFLGDATVARLRNPGLAQLRVEAKVAGQVARAREAA